MSKQSEEIELKNDNKELLIGISQRGQVTFLVDNARESEGTITVYADRTDEPKVLIPAGQSAVVQGNAVRVVLASGTSARFKYAYLPS